ncbi:hypothetical protein [Methylosinus sp. Sm6]|uniref:hypothetical protein n=1 Tax=Methylosinus sp. Sm6 TaxID=2866948 RepID=UPI001C993FA1|nr:hypothetical protein [Methylosinus sp. Sm6]MBY6239913.1 hypothetical protein [Methylosinus sp. Sm6]
MSRRRFAFLAIAAAGILAGAPAVAFKSPADAPAAWRDYAALVKSRVQDWLSGDDEPAKRLRASLDARAPERGAATRFVARLWFLADGEVTRAEFEGVEAAAAVELRALVLHRRIGAPPPADMAQPMHLQLSLQVESHAALPERRG